MKNIPLIILCGGLGSRLREETEFKPKSMIAVGDKPIIWHIMKVYKHQGFNNFIFALGYKGEMIADYFLKNNKEKFNITAIDTGQETLTGERILKLKKYIKTDLFMVTYGDGVGNVDVNEVIKYHKKKKVIGTITGVHPTSKWGLINSDENNLIISFRQKPVLKEYVNGGFMVFNRSFLSYLRKGEMIEDAFIRLTEKKQLAVYNHDDFWHAMDTYQDMEEFNKMWKKNPKWKIWK